MQRSEFECYYFDSGIEFWTEIEFHYRAIYNLKFNFHTERTFNVQNYGHVINSFSINHQIQFQFKIQIQLRAMSQERVIECL